MKRFPIKAVKPVVEFGEHAAKAIIGQDIIFRAEAFREGHDLLGVELVIKTPAGKTRHYSCSESNHGLAIWEKQLRIAEVGVYKFYFQCWSDPFATWLRSAEIKINHNLESDLMISEGLILLEKMLSDAKTKKLKDATKSLMQVADEIPDPVQVLEQWQKSGIANFGRQNPIREFITKTKTHELKSERRLAGFGSWYEFFPRSEGAFENADGSWTSGNFKTALKRLPGVAKMGFDVLYLPPIHPIGEQFRKGRNNSLNPSPTDPGSPWAIGSKAGGHESIHPDLGTESGFREFVAAANKLGIEIALDFALQASPDHPWVASHPQWFTSRADGSIAYAENPPKKYQDIFPINFDNDPEGIFAESFAILEKWISLGVFIYRVDNPHTKPLWFWKKLIANINERHPEVIFLAEAFTTPPMMHELGKVGFQQSYTYFTWRNTKPELEQYLHEVTKQTDDFFRPNFWVNTPDILPQYLQFGGRPAFKIRALLAATSSPLWGMYSGFELYESVARKGSEEYIDSEKYQYRPREFETAEKAGDSLAPFISWLNELRNSHICLQQLSNLEIHWSEDDSILVYSKQSPADSGNPETLIFVVNTDPHSVRETNIHLDLERLGLPTSFKVEDLINSQKYIWGKSNFVRLDAFSHPAHVMKVIW